MKTKTTALLAISALLCLFSVPQAQAQCGPHPRGGNWGAESPYNRLYNTKTIETISGEVIAVEQITPINGMSAGVHVQLKTGKATISVHLGPAWFIENQDLSIETKDMIEIKGSRIMLDGKSAIIASQIKKTDQVLMLRDENGVPSWAGWRRR